MGSLQSMRIELQGQLQESPPVAALTLDGGAAPTGSVFHGELLHYRLRPDYADTASESPASQRSITPQGNFGVGCRDEAVIISALSAFIRGFCIGGLYDDYANDWN